ncbi:MAG: protease modulator HflC [Candidatus Aminicenantaceae bacterium]
MNKQTKLIISMALLVGFIIVIANSFYIVKETNQVIILQFGKPIGEAVTNPGLHIKLPFIRQATYFEKRWLEWNGDVNQIPTRDKKFIEIDTYARWRISDPLVFFQSVRDERGAQSRLDDIIDGETRNAIANYDLEEVVRSTNRVFEETEEAGVLTEREEVVTIETGRDNITEIILKASSIITPAIGIELKDVRIKRINYIEEVRQEVFGRMIAERQRIAAKYRSEGDGRSAEIRGEKERELKRIQSGAYKTAQEIKGKADAEATRIYRPAIDATDPGHESFQGKLAEALWEATPRPGSTGRSQA